MRDLVWCAGSTTESPQLDAVRRVLSLLLGTHPPGECQSMPDHAGRGSFLALCGLDVVESQQLFRVGLL